MKLDDGLKIELERVADLLKKFPESLHVKVFDLILHGKPTHAAASAEPAPGVPAAKPKKAKKPTSSKAGVGVKSAGGISTQVPKRIDDLDLGHSSEPDSFGSYVLEKAPESNFEFNAVTVHYLAEKKKIDAITIDHIYTCYDLVNRPIPEAFVQSLRDTKKKKGYINIDDWNSIKLATKGKNLVVHDLPKKKAK